MDGWVTIGTELDTKMIDKQIKELENDLSELEKEYEEVTAIKMFEWQEKKAKKLRIEIGRVKDQISKLKSQKMRIDMFGDVKSSVNDIGNGLSKTIKKVTRWGLAIFGIRSAYMAIRNAINVISQDDEQLKADIEYIKSALAYTLEPVVRRIVELVKQLLLYVGYLIKQWTGKNIFENANKSLANANKNAKALSKTMAGFDEMNVLSDTSSGAGGGVTPSFDLSQMQGEVPKWLQWLANNGETVIAILSGIVVGLTSIKLGASALLGLGIGVAIAGIISLILDVIKFIKDPSWENFTNILRDLTIVLAGVAIAMIAFNATNPVGWIMLAISALGLLLTTVLKNWDKIKNTLNSALQWIKDRFNSLPGWAQTLLKGIGNAVIAVVNTIISALNGFLLPLRTAIMLIGKVTGKNWSLSTISIPHVPYLAKGGIVNNPGPGVMMGSYIAGERGPEAVIPLDDQTLDRLGLAFARHTNINVSLTNTMNGRVISKELQRVQNDSDFAFNR